MIGRVGGGKRVGDGDRSHIRSRLGGHTRYTVRLGGDIVDRGDNRVPAGERTWRFRTRG